jgi:peptidoglycan/LPS O-acetylase OafA/YrhL
MTLLATSNPSAADPAGSTAAMTFERLQILRGLAALAVLVCHLAEHQLNAFGVKLAPGAALGWAGVDLFFVLSGFIIARSAFDQAPGAGAAAGFFVARLARTFPPWWVALFATAALAAFAPGLLAYKGEASLLESALLIPALAQPILSVGWTLVMEMAFYAIFALLLLAPHHWRAGALMAWGVFILIASTASWRGEQAWATVLANPLCLEFLAGVWIARALARMPSPAPAAGFGLTGLALLGGFGMIAGAAVHTLLADGLGGAGGEWVRALAVGGPAALVVWCMARLDARDLGVATPERPWAWRAGVALGDRSYALYLVHYPILSAIALLIAAELTGPLGVASYWALGLAATALATWALHAFVERPAIAASKRARGAFRARATRPV